MLDKGPGVAGEESSGEEGMIFKGREISLQVQVSFRQEIMGV